ncbi:MAG: hypothetical protein A2600_10265 [Candidatus Lambdaproteobacteria bacterium RIFOXYD1_FULL_56_27]|uniref:Uncharacterized protein n=1 Tax=Candidatus Lambdaproteobacteria bacterium RIFOXYD2_FULL_56_26 TaxID=1817773 RepID=A0A1F6GQG4_9PROT|nr:MAG: hypothetical protein A2557_09420 [Candidatus Lambdaproteobacteria bacterium RIFOXYD2_FULL_56_26]OGH04149.1 MAG: hypothetical protein A2426_02810 [Candidatus Lambdaproteobacteria bacterium RIFOXYC1_FULL_56_13]OGH06334.1 MAG: hypothetical protein A2600_10265 [Candidatus Lambdaproteobacteria bacterium RIFOXYD1_FULL_56_27]
MFTLILCSLASVLIAALVVKPFFLSPEKPYFDPQAQPHVFDESLSLLEGLGELETDYRLGKLNAEEFEHLSLEIKRDYLKLKHES